MLRRATRLTAVANAVRRMLANVFEGAAAAYSLRIPALSTYTGPLVRVRRSSDNVEADIAAAGPQLATNRFFASAANWTLGANVTITGGAMVASGDAFTLFSQNMGLVTGRTYSVTLLANKTGWGGAARIRASTSNSLTSEGSNQVALSSPNPPNGLSVYTAQITANNPILVFASSDAIWNGSVFSVSVQDVNPAAGTERWLNETALLAHVGIGAGFVTTWYDQSGNSVPALKTNTTLQPRIVNAGIIDSLNNRPTINFLLGTHLLSAATATNFTGALVSAVFAKANSTTGPQLFDWRQIGNGTPLIDDGGTGGFAIRLRNNGNQLVSTAGTPNTNPNVYSGVWNGSLLDVRLNGGASATANVSGQLTLNRLGIGTNGDTPGSNPWEGRMSEILVRAVLISADARQALERSQGAAFGITVA